MSLSQSLDLSFTYTSSTTILQSIVLIFFLKAHCSNLKKIRALFKDPVNAVMEYCIVPTNNMTKDAAGQ